MNLYGLFLLIRINNAALSRKTRVQDDTSGEAGHRIDEGPRKETRTGLRCLPSSQIQEVFRASSRGGLLVRSEGSIASTRKENTGTTACPLQHPFRRNRPRAVPLHFLRKSLPSLWKLRLYFLELFMATSEQTSGHIEGKNYVKNPTVRSHMAN